MSLPLRREKIMKSISYRSCSHPKNDPDDVRQGGVSGGHQTLYPNGPVDVSCGVGVPEHVVGLPSLEPFTRLCTRS